MSLAEAWTRILGDGGADDPGATIGDRTVVMAETTPTRSPSIESRTAATSGRALASELSTDAVTRYRYRERIGRGGMGEVLRVEQTSIGREVALKTLRSDRRDPAIAEAFQAETRVTAGLEHPGVVPVHDAGVDYLAMKLVEGETLAELIAARSDLEDRLADLVEILVRVADCLAYAHDRGILHRDLKPANIMVGAYGEVYLMDWGLALAHRSDCALPRLPQVSAAANICAGSPAYLPPEVARGERDAISPASDVFGLGAILHEVLTGQPPFDGATVREVLSNAAAAQREPIPSAIAGRHSELAALGERMLADRPEDRAELPTCQRELRAWLEVSGRRTAAQRHHQAAQQAYDRALLATESGLIYALLADCANECERALALDHGSEDSRRLRRDAHRRRAEEALRVGDLVLAQAVLDEDDDPDLEPLRERLAGAFHRRQRWRERTRRARRWSARLALTAAGLLVVAGGYHLVEQHLHREERRRQALALIEPGAPDVAAGRSAHQRAVNRSLRAAGLHPEPEAIAPAVRAAAESYLAWAIEQRSADLARSLLGLAQRHGLDATRAAAIEGDTETPGTIAHSAAAEERQRRAERERREHRMAAIVATAGARELEPDWLPKRAAELCSWRADDDDRVTATHTAELLASLLWHPDPLLRRLGHLTRRALGRDHGASPVLAALPETDRFPVLFPPDPDPHAQSEAVVNRLMADERQVVAAMEAAIAIDQRPVAAALENRIRPWVQRTLRAHRSAYFQDPDWIKLAIILSQHRYYVAHDEPMLAHLLRNCWDDRLREVYHDLNQAFYDGRVNQALGYGRTILERELTVVAFAHTAWCLLLLERVDELDALVGRWLSEHPEPRHALPYQAHVHRARGEYAAADAALDRAVDQVLDGHLLEHDCMVRLMIMLRRQDRSDEAIMIARIMAEARPHARVVFNNIGWTLYEAGRYQEAADQTMRTLEHWPGIWQPWSLRARALYALDRYREALAACDHSIAVDPDGGHTRGWRAMSLAKLGRWTEALRDLEAEYASHEAATDLEALKLGIPLARRAGDAERARWLAARWVAVDPDSDTAHATVTRLALEHGAVDAALDALERALDQAADPSAAVETVLLTGRLHGLGEPDPVLGAEVAALAYLREAFSHLAFPTATASSSVDALLAHARTAHRAPWVETGATFIAHLAASGRIPEELSPAETEAPAWIHDLLAVEVASPPSATGWVMVDRHSLAPQRPLPAVEWSSAQRARLAELLARRLAQLPPSSDRIPWQRLISRLRATE